MNSFTTKVNKLIVTVISDNIDNYDTSHDFYGNVGKISEYFLELVPHIISNSCEVKTQSDDDGTTDILDINYDSGKTRYNVLLNKINGTYRHCCSLILRVIRNGRIVRGCQIVADIGDLRGEAHHLNPDDFLDRMLKYIFNHMNENERCFFYLVDPSIQNFFEFEKSPTIEMESRFTFEDLCKLFGLR